MTVPFFPAHWPTPYYSDNDYGKLREPICTAGAVSRAIWRPDLFAACCLSGNGWCRPKNVSIGYYQSPEVHSRHAHVTLSSQLEYNLIGSWLNCVLLVTEALAVCAYMSKYYEQLRRPTKWVVFGMLGNDIIQSVIVCITAYLVCYLL